MFSNQSCSNRFLILIVVLVVILDQVSKYLVLKQLSLDSYYQVTSFFRIILTFNTGASFGFLAGITGGNAIFIFSNICILTALMNWVRKVEIGGVRVAIALIVGGGIGNIVDRIIYSGVVDFIDLYYNAWHYPAFNIADILICMGVLIIILYMLFQHQFESGDGKSF